MVSVKPRIHVIQGCVDLCRCLSIPSNVDACQCRLMFMPTRFDIDYCRFLPMSKHVDPMSTDHCRLISMSVLVNTTHVDASSGQLRLISMTVQVDVDNYYCRHSVHGVVQWIQLILETSSDLRLEPTVYVSLRWIWITRRPTPTHFIGQEEIITGLNILRCFYSDAFSIYIAISIISLWQLVLW